MDEQVKTIFRDAGASEDDLAYIEAMALTVATEVRRLIVESSNLCPKVELRLPLRVLLARVIHADMEKAFSTYRTTDGQGNPLSTH